jgi:hypothetical protein
MSSLGDLVVDEGVVFIVTFDGRQSLLGVRRSMAPLIDSGPPVRLRPELRKTRRRYGGAPAEGAALGACVSTIAELRAFVGDAGADLDDEQLQRLDVVTDRLAEIVVGAQRDRMDPAAAVVRREEARRRIEQLTAPRRRKYAREKSRKAARVGRVPGSGAWGSTAGPNGR